MKMNSALLLNDVTTTIVDGKTHLHVDVDAEIGKDELINIRYRRKINVPTVHKDI